MKSITPSTGGGPLRPADGPRAEFAENSVLVREEPGGNVDLREFVRAIMRHKLVLVASIVVCTGFAVYKVKQHIPQYRAQATIRVADERRALTGGFQTGAADQMLGKATDPLQSHIEVLRSRSVIGAVIDTLRLQLRALNSHTSTDIFSSVDASKVSAVDTVVFSFRPDKYTGTLNRASATARYGDPLRVGNLVVTVDGPPQNPRAEFALHPRERLITVVSKRLDVGRRTNTDIVDVQFTHPDPERAAEVANAVVEAFQAANARTAQQQSRRRRMFVQEQLAETDSILSEAQLQVERFRVREQMYSSQQRLSAEQSAAMQLDGRIQELRAEKEIYATLLATVRQRTNAPAERLQAIMATASVSENPMIAQLTAQLVKLQTARDSLTAGRWGAAATNPDVARIDTLIAATEARIAAGTDSHLAALDARLQALENVKQRSADVLATLPATESEEMRLAQRVETTRKIADQLREEYQKARIAEAVEAGQVEIIDQAAVPTFAVDDRAWRTIMIGLFLGVLLGAGIAYVLEHLNTAIKRQDEMEKVLQVPGLAVIPQIMSKTPRTRLLLGHGNGTRKTRALVTISDFKSSGAEAFRTLRTNLIFSQAVQSLHRIVITSAFPSEGKTTTVANLAVTFAQQGLRVLIVDADLRRPRMHDVFHMTRVPGLTDVLIDQATLSGAVRETAVPNLFLLPAGLIAPNPAELLGNARTQQVLDKLNEQFDLVMLDAAPLLAVSDAMILGRMADGVLLVVRAGKTEKTAAQHAIQQLTNVGARVVGAVLNDPDAQVPKYSEYYGYGYTYYGASEDEERAQTPAATVENRG